MHLIQGNHYIHKKSEKGIINKEQIMIILLVLFAYLRKFLVNHNSRNEFF